MYVRACVPFLEASLGSLCTSAPAPAKTPGSVSLALPRISLWLDICLTPTSNTHTHRHLHIRMQSYTLFYSGRCAPHMHTLCSSLMFCVLTKIILVVLPFQPDHILHCPLELCFHILILASTYIGVFVHFGSPASAACHLSYFKHILDKGCCFFFFWTSMLSRPPTRQDTVEEHNNDLAVDQYTFTQPVFFRRYILFPSCLLTPA